MAIQLLGKTRFMLSIPADPYREALKEFVGESNLKQRYIEDKEMIKTIVVTGKLIDCMVT